MSSVAEALGPVVNALAVVMLVACVYAVLGVQVGRAYAEYYIKIYDKDTDPSSCPSHPLRLPPL